MHIIAIFNIGWPYKTQITDELRSKINIQNVPQKSSLALTSAFIGQGIKVCIAKKNIHVLIGGFVEMDKA